MFFFFKQKTAYEMRISDWSSDVCSSDLSHHARTQEGQRGLRPRQGQLGTSRARPVETDRNQPGGNRRIQGALCHPVRASSGWLGLVARRESGSPQTLSAVLPSAAPGRTGGDGGRHARLLRSEEHTSALQSLLRITSAVFCMTTN